jgi:hypothetical protein
VLAKDTLEAEAEAQRGRLGGFVQVVALPLEAPVAEIVEDVARGEVEGLCGGARARDAESEILPISITPCSG